MLQGPRSRKGFREDFISSSSWLRFRHALSLRFDKPGKKPEDIRKAVEVSNGLGIDAIGAAGHGDNAALCSPAGRSGHVQRGSAQIMAWRCPMFEDDVIVFFQVVHHIG